jgi:hypothetical protein
MNKPHRTFIRNYRVAFGVVYTLGITIHGSGKWLKG